MLPNSPRERPHQTGSLAPLHQSIQGQYNAQAGPGGYAAVNVYQQVMRRQIDADTLEAARSLLLTMPTDTIPPIAPLAASSRIRYSHNHLFVGRGDEMLKLAGWLKGSASDGSGTPPVAIVTGLGGLGKTQLVAEWVHHYGQYFAGGVFWLSFADTKGVPTEIAQCRSQLIRELPAHINSLSQDEQVQLILSAWMSPLPRLLIFDNCEEEALLTQWLPPTGGCSILVTSRREHWSPHLGFSHVRLETLPRHESIALLGNYRTGIVQADSNEIAHEVGDLPLALHLAGSYLHQDERLETQTYLKLLRQAPLLHLQLDEDDPNEPSSPTKHDQHIGRTFAVSYQQLQAERAGDQQALLVLACVACLAPGEPIPSDLLVDAVLRPVPTPPKRQGFLSKMIERLRLKPTAQVGGQPPVTPFNKQGSLNKAIRRLSNLGLLEVLQSQVVRQHRLLITFVTTVMDQEMMKQAQYDVEATLIERALILQKQYRLLAVQQWHQHLRVVTERAMDHSDEQASFLCYMLSRYLDESGSYAEALLYAQRSLAIDEQELGPQHPDTASNLNNLALLYQNQGKYVEAEPLLQRALAICEQELGPQHPLTATSLNNLALLYRVQGKYAEAEPLYQRALAIREQVLGSLHPDTANGLNNLALLYQVQGKLEEAESLFLQALAICEQVLGPLHSHTATCLDNLAVLYQAQGKYAEAEPLLQRALAIYEKVLGTQHPLTATSLNNLALLYRAQGKLEEAEPPLQRALAICEQVLGPLHPDMAAYLDNLAMLYEDQGKGAEAEELYQRLREIEAACTEQN